jgi:hypothetical protein
MRQYAQAINAIGVRRIWMNTDIFLSSKVAIGIAGFAGIIAAIQHQ